MFEAEKIKSQLKLDVSERHEYPLREYEGGSQMFHPFIIPSVTG